MSARAKSRARLYQRGSIAKCFVSLPQLCVRGLSSGRSGLGGLDQARHGKGVNGIRCRTAAHAARFPLVDDTGRKRLLGEIQQIEFFICFSRS